MPREDRNWCWTDSPGLRQLLGGYSSTVEAPASLGRIASDRTYCSRRFGRHDHTCCGEVRVVLRFRVAVFRLPCLMGCGAPEYFGSTRCTARNTVHCSYGIGETGDESSKCNREDIDLHLQACNGLLSGFQLSEAEKAVVPCFSQPIKQPHPLSTFPVNLKHAKLLSQVQRCKGGRGRTWKTVASETMAIESSSSR